MGARVLAWSPPVPGAPFAGDDRWWHYAACLGADLRLFFADPEAAPAKTAAAKALCAACPARAACLADALRLGDSHSVRGGLTAAERRELFPPAPRCRAGLHPLTPENTGQGGGCLRCRRAREARDRTEERMERTGSTAPQYGHRAAA